MFNRAKYYQKLYSVDSSILPKDSDILDVPTPINDEENEQLFPQDPTTGQLADLLSQILQTENPLLRDSLMSKLETLPSNSSALAGVDDATKIVALDLDQSLDQSLEQSLEQHSTVREQTIQNQQNLTFQKQTL